MATHPKSNAQFEDRTGLTGSNKFEMLLFRLGAGAKGERSELFGINVFKIREIVAMPKVTAVAGSTPHMLGVVDLRGQIIPVIDLPSLVGCTPQTGLNIMLVTEFARTTQAFAVESVEEIVRLDWSQVLSGEGSNSGGMVTSIARLDGDKADTRLAQVLDVESILRSVVPPDAHEMDADALGPRIALKPGSVVLAADDSNVARNMIEQSLQALGVPYIMTKSGKEAWEQLQVFSLATEREGKPIRDKIALVLTDLEMPEMDGFTLTRNIKQDPRFATIPVVIHSSLTGSANEAHVRNVGADAYVAKFAPQELAGTLR